MIQFPGSKFDISAINNRHSTQISQQTQSLTPTGSPGILDQPQKLILQFSMNEFFCSYGNEYNSYQSLSYVPQKGFSYTKEGGLSSIEVSLPDDIISEIDKAILGLPTQSVIDSSIGLNPNPGERHYDTRTSFYLKFGNGIEYKFLTENNPKKECLILLQAFEKAFKFCAEVAGSI